MASLNPKSPKNILARSMSCTTIVQWSKCFTMLYTPCASTAMRGNLKGMPTITSSQLRTDFPSSASFHLYRIRGEPDSRSYLYQTDKASLGDGQSNQLRAPLLHSLN